MDIIAGARLPAEWEPHEAVWIGWPHHVSDWRPKFAAIPWVFAEMIRHLLGSERVELLVQDEAHEIAAVRVLDRAVHGWWRLEEEGVRFRRIPTDRGWTRDFLPFFVYTPQGGRVLHCGFSGWARYANHKRDHAAGLDIAELVVQERSLPLHTMRLQPEGAEVVLEGGALDSNGSGTLLCTEECLLDPVCQVRNPGMGAREYEALFAACFGVTNVIWLGQGIAGDDTHGHVDDFCRFVSPNTVLLCEAEETDARNYAPMEENRERLEGARLEDDGRVEIIRLPLPRPVYFGEQRLPASYANFYIGNTVVLAPTFNDPKDRMALGILAECFPDRQVVGVHAVDLVLGLGAVHCLTHEQPLFV
jgi:agmatine deiminase